MEFHCIIAIDNVKSKENFLIKNEGNSAFSEPKFHSLLELGLLIGIILEKETYRTWPTQCFG
jgi:hypothetical protein